MTRLREAIGYLLYRLFYWGFWRPPDYWFTASWGRRYGYGQLDYWTGEFQFPVRCLEVTRNVH